MSRTYRKNYIPLRSKEEAESIEKYKTDALYYSANGSSVEKIIWYTKHFYHKSGCAYIRFDKSVGRDGNKAHADLKAMHNIGIKKIDSKVREKLRQEMRRIKAGVLDYDEHLLCANKIRIRERSFVWLELT